METQFYKGKRRNALALGLLMLIAVLPSMALGAPSGLEEKKPEPAVEYGLMDVKLKFNFQSEQNGIDLTQTDIGASVIFCRVKIIPDPYRLPLEIGASYSNSETKQPATETEIKKSDIFLRLKYDGWPEKIKPYISVGYGTTDVLQTSPTEPKVDEHSSSFTFTEGIELPIVKDLLSINIEYSQTKDASLDETLVRRFTTGIEIKLDDLIKKEKPI